MKHLIIKKNKIFLVTIIFIFSLNFIFSQSDSQKDLNSWTTIGIEYKLNTKWEFSLEEQLRLKEDISVIDETFTQFNTEYLLFKGFTIGAGVRFIKENDNRGKIQGYEDHFRFHFQSSFKHKINKLALKYRLRYQNKNELGKDDVTNQHIRFKTYVGYNFKNWKLDPKFSAELYHKIGDEISNKFDKYRFTLGTEYKFKKLGKLNIFFRVEKELNELFPETTNIIGLKYIYTIKN